MTDNQIPADPPEPKLDFEFFAIVASGMYLHLKQLSIIDLKHSKLPGIQPNPASAIFVFSVLCVLAKSRPYWPRCLRPPPRILRFFVELFLTLYVTDRILRQVWIPMLKFVNFMCNFLSDYMVVVNTSLLANQTMAVAAWLRSRAFYYVRYMISMSVFYFMAEVTGLAEYCRDVKNRLKAKATKSRVTFSESVSQIRPRASSLSTRRSETGSINIPSPVSRSTKKNRKSIITPRKYRTRQYVPYHFHMYG